MRRRRVHQTGGRNRDAARGKENTAPRMRPSLWRRSQVAEQGPDGESAPLLGRTSTGPTSTKGNNQASLDVPRLCISFGNKALNVGHSLVSFMANCCSSRVGRSPHVAAIQTYSDFAPIEEQPVIQSLRESVCERADFLDPSHEAQLQTLLQRLVPGTTFDKDFDWRALGFQSANCRTDFRGSGLSGLRCLNHLAEHYPDEYRRYIAHPNIDNGGTAGAVSYPCSASALAMVLVLVNHLKLSLHPPLMSPDCGTEIQNPSVIDRNDLRTFLKLLEEHPGHDKEFVFREIFCAAVSVVHNVWVSEPRKDMDIMNFNRLTYMPAWRAVRRALLGAYAANGDQSLAQVCAAIRAFRVPVN